MTGFTAESSVKRLGQSEKFDRPTSTVRFACISQNCWFAPVKVNSVDTTMLVDTGSDVTLISAEVFKAMNMDKSLLRDVSTCLTTADGDPLEVMGITTIPLDFCGQSFDHQVVVASIGELSGILGIDFLSANKVSIETSEGMLRSPKFEIKLHHQSNSIVCARVHLTDTVHIPARSEIFVEGEVRGHFNESQDGCLEPLVKFKGGCDLLIPKSLVKMTESKVLFSIWNPTPDARILKKHAQVASVQTVEQVMDCYSGKAVAKQNTGSKGIILPEHLIPLIENCSEKVAVHDKER